MAICRLRDLQGSPTKEGGVQSINQSIILDGKVRVCISVRRGSGEVRVGLVAS